jgi:tetratricopeptide (TPR) repeat protein
MTELAIGPEGGVTARSPLVTGTVPGGANYVTPPCHRACHLAPICDTRKKATSKEAVPMNQDRPAWARRMASERKVRGWSQAEAVRALRANAAEHEHLPDDSSLLRQWKRWEAGTTTPNDFYQPIIAKTFGTVTHAMFPVPPRRDANAEILAESGLDTVELVARLQRSDMDDATLNAVRIMADSLCCEYASTPADQLLVQGRSWLRRITQYSGQRLTLKQHTELLVQAGWMALLIACVEYDTGDRQAAETTRQGALSLGIDTDHAVIQAWAHEIRAWMNLTTGDYHGVVAAAQHGLDVAPHHPVAVQLAAQEAKAWARIGDRRQTEVALDRGRRLLDSLPYPENLDNHFVVDPTKFDFYAMDCYRMLAEDKMAENLADEVIRASTDFDGTERAPMRLAEARITLGVVAARQGDVEEALHHGEQALNGRRKSLPSLLMVSRDLTRVLRERYPSEQVTQTYLRELQAMSQTHEPSAASGT